MSKVFCYNCIHRKHYLFDDVINDECKINFKSSWLKEKNHYSKCANINKDNDCKDYEQKK